VDDPAAAFRRVVLDLSGDVCVVASQLLTAVLRRLLEPGQYLSIRYTERLDEAGAICSVGSRGDSYDNALAEAVNGLYKAELIGKRGPWRSLEQVELATAEWVDWWNHRRLHGAIRDMPPAEFEALYHSQRDAPAAA
jgi:putative transposase